MLNDARVDERGVESKELLHESEGADIILYVGY